MNKVTIMKKLLTTACLFVVTIVAIVTFIAASTVFGQEKKQAEREAMYYRYLDFASYVKGGSITPHWMADGSSFWYAEGAPENTVIWKIDPKANTKKPLFDTARLRKALTPVMGQAADQSPIEIPFVKFVLPNGLTVITHEDRTAPIVAATVWYRVGTKDERQGRSGFAHLFEHLLVGAHDTLTSDLASAGALELNGTYGRDATKFYATLPSSMLDLLLFYQSQLMGTTAGRITQSVLDKERGIVKNENREYQQDRSFGRVPLLLAQTTYPPGHPYASVELGSLADLDAATLADASAWLTAYYGPANAVLVVAGDFDATTIKQKVESYFGAIARGPAHVRPAPSVSPGSTNRYETVFDRIPGARVYRTWNIPEWGSADAAYLEMAGAIIGGSPSSRLYQRLVRRETLATDVSVSVNLFQLGGQLSLVVTPAQESHVPVIGRALDEEMSRFIEQGPTLEELAQAQRRYRANFLRGIERIGSEPIGGFRGRSELLAAHEVNAGRADFYKTALSRVASATIADVRKAAAQWLGEGAFTLDLRPLPTETPRGAAETDRMSQPPRQPFPKFQSAPIRRRELSNGLRVLLVERSAIPLVELRLRLGAGSRSDRDGVPGRAALTTQLLAEGTTGRSADRILNDLLDLGARLSTSIDEDASMISLSGPADRLPRMLDLLADLVMNPVFPEAAVDLKRREYDTRLQRERASPPASPGALLQTLLDGSLPSSPRAETATRPEGLRRDDLVSFFRAAFRPDNATLVVAGAATLDALVPHVERAFGGWRRPTATSRAAATPTSPGAPPAVYMIDAPGSTQSVIATGHLGLAANDPDFDVLRILATVLRFRLHSNLRETKQWSYAPYAFLGSGVTGRQMFGAVAAVQQDKTAETMLELLKELRGLAGGRPATPEEIERAKTSELRLLAVFAQTNALTAQRVDEASRVTPGIDDFETLARRRAAIGSADVSRVAARLIQPERLSWLVIGDEKAIANGVAALNLGKIRHITADGIPRSETR